MVSENEAFHALTASIERIKSCGGKFLVGWEPFRRR